MMPTREAVLDRRAFALLLMTYKSDLELFSRMPIRLGHFPLLHAAHDRLLHAVNPFLGRNVAEILE